VQYTPQHHGVVERKNKTIMKMAHNMFAAKHLSNMYWAEAIAIAVYILNKCPTKSVKNIVPQETSTRLNHNVSHLKVLGCVAYTHVPYEMRKNMDKKGHTCIYVE
jgi:Asp/Glu/hydantoin racemase